MVFKRPDRRAFLAGAASLPALAGCDVAGRNLAVFRFKVIARARLGGKTYEGFSVNEMRARYTPNTLLGYAMRRSMKVEAAVVDFGGAGDALFVLLVDYLPVIGLLWGVPVSGDADETTIGGLRAINGVRDYPRKNPDAPTLDRIYPRIAAFQDEADPTSVYQIDPDNLAKTHGRDARFLGISIEIVDPKTPLTNAIQQRLPWLEPGSSRRMVPIPAGGQPMSKSSFSQRTTHHAFNNKG